MIYLVTIKGKEHNWNLPVDISEETALALETDGVEIIKPRYRIPEWAFNWKVEKAYAFLQDLFYLRNPFKG